MNSSSQTIFLFLFFVSQLFLSDRVSADSLNENINWVDFETAKSDSSRPSVIILHKSWCPACKALKAKLSDSVEFEKLSLQFSMVSANEDDPLHSDSQFDLDGSYIPRVFFLNPNGEILTDIQNPKGNPNYKYYHYNAQTVMDAMNKVLKDFPVKDEL